MYKTTLLTRGNYAALAALDGRLYLACRGAGGRLALAWSVAGYHFEGWRPLPLVTNSDPALASADGRLFLAWVGLDGSIRLASSVDGVLWEGETRLPNRSTTGPALAAEGGRVHVVWTDEEDHALHFGSAAYAEPLRCDAVTPYLTSVTPALAAHGGRLRVASVGKIGSIPNLAAARGKAMPSCWQSLRLPPQTAFRPALAVLHKRLYLAWTSPRGILHVAASDDGEAFGPPQPLNEHGLHAAIAEFEERLYVAWEWPEGDLHVARL